LLHKNAEFAAKTAAGQFFSGGGDYAFRSNREYGHERQYFSISPGAASC